MFVNLVNKKGNVKQKGVIKPMFFFSYLSSMYQLNLKDFQSQLDLNCKFILVYEYVCHCKTSSDEMSRRICQAVARYIFIILCYMDFAIRQRQ